MVVLHACSSVDHLREFVVSLVVAVVAAVVAVLVLTVRLALAASIQILAADLAWTSARSHLTVLGDAAAAVAQAKSAHSLAAQCWLDGHAL